MLVEIKEELVQRFNVLKALPEAKKKAGIKKNATLSSFVNEVTEMEIEFIEIDNK